MTTHENTETYDHSTRMGAERTAKRIVEHWRRCGYPTIWAEASRLGIVGRPNDGYVWTVTSNLGPDGYPPRNRDLEWIAADIARRRVAAEATAAKFFAEDG